MKNKTMRTLLISGTDTGIGKTRVTGLLAALLPGEGETVQIVKPVETGVRDGDAGDAENASTQAKKRKLPIETRTLFRFPDPLAPVAAARTAGTELSAAGILSSLNRLPAPDWRFIEGAGGIAVPLETGGFDWTDFAAALGRLHVVLVVADRLGAINQARLAAHYVQCKGLSFSIWLNETDPQPEVIRRTNRNGLSECGLTPVFHLDHNGNSPDRADAVRSFYLETASQTGSARHRSAAQEPNP